ncbi:MAG TPA: hypothetical protein VKZ93_06750 [Arenibacter sp.]|nr:hypothetical protein [Arenibacter sp.]
MLFYRFAYLKFWITATDQHGVHSPFIYRYVTQCLYSAPHFRTNPSTNILLKTMAYFKLKEIQPITENDQIHLQIAAHTNGVSIVPTSQKLIYLDSLNTKTIDEYLVHNKEIINDTIMYIPNIHKTKDRYIFWEKIKELEKVTVSVDMFYGGLVFFRREQAKEHFKIRI